MYVRIFNKNDGVVEQQAIRVALESSRLHLALCAEQWESPVRESEAGAGEHTLP